MYETILVPTDGSRGSRVATDHALQLAGHHDASVHGIHVVSPSHVEGLSRPNATVESMHDHGEELLEGIATRADRRGIPCQTSVLEGTPHEVILDCVDDHDVDLVVMGTHGHTGLQRYLLGSITERVLRRAPVPVLVLSPADAPDVDDAETARELARESLREEGHEDVTLQEPHRQESTWVVTAEGEDGRFEVHVGAAGETHVTRLD